MEEKTKIIFDSDFFIEVKLDDGSVPKGMIGTIYSFTPPTINLNVDENMQESTMKAVLTIRLDKNGRVENEIYEKLSNTFIQLKLYYPDANALNWEYKNCTIESIEYDSFERKSKYDKPFNMRLNLLVQQAVYHASNTTLSFGTIDEGKGIRKNGK